MSDNRFTQKSYITHASTKNLPRPNKVIKKDTTKKRLNRRISEYMNELDKECACGMAGEESLNVYFGS